MVVSRVIKRTDLKGERITAHPIASLGEYRMKYRYQYLIDDFPNRTLTDLRDLENVGNIQLPKILWSCENYLKKQKIAQKYICDKEMTTSDGDIILLPGMLQERERRMLQEIFALPAAAAERYRTEIEPELTIGMLLEIAMKLYTENLQKSIVLLALIDDVYKRNKIAVADLSVERGMRMAALQQTVSQLTAAEGGEPYE